MSTINNAVPICLMNSTLCRTNATNDVVDCSRPTIMHSVICYYIWQIFHSTYSHGLIRFSVSVCVCVFLCMHVCFFRYHGSSISHKKCKKSHCHILTFDIEWHRNENCMLLSLKRLKLAQKCMKQLL